MTEEITEAIRNAFNEYLNAVDEVILENQALQIELQRLKEKCFAVEQESIQKSQTICDLKQKNDNLKSCLEEIREIADDAKNHRYATKSDDYTEGMETVGSYVLNVINEVLGNEKM